jgi:uncharacterized protein YxjI
MMLEEFYNHLVSSRKLHVEQVLEGFEIILGWETRNKYRILDQDRRPLAYAAEKSSGILGSVVRQFFGHWRAFKIVMFNELKQPMLEMDFPFRFIFKTMHLRRMDGVLIGTVERRFAFFSKKFDVLDAQGRVQARINSSFFKWWTFEFKFGPRKLGTLQKKWSGALSEIFTDKDNFVVTFTDPDLSPELKALMLATSLIVDIVYFENNQGKKSLMNVFDG